MSRLDIRGIRRKYLKSKKSDEVLKGCFHKDDLKKYHILEDLIKVKGYAYLTVEISKGRHILIKTIKVDKIRAIRGTTFFLYDNEIVFEYDKEKNIRIGVDLEQNSYQFEYYNYPQAVSYEDLVEITEQLLKYHYDDIYHLWIDRMTVDKFADQLDLNLPSRINLHKVYLEFCQKQYVDHYGVENRRITDLMNELKEDPRYYIGYHKYDRCLAEDNPIASNGSV